MPLIALEALEPHPDNANRMPEPLRAKLAEHIRDSGDYPPLIVRGHPSADDRYQVLDGHHRLEALRRIGYEEARCEIWEADDERAAVLLLTLNRLQGSDDPRRRGALLKKLAVSSDVRALAARLPEDAARIRRLIELSAPPPPPVAPPDPATMPHTVTFFLTAPQRRRLLERLRAVARDRSAALIGLLELDG
jgi:ParB-like chromosome segregation protein Spo0J